MARGRPRLAPVLDFARSADGLAGLLTGAGLVVADAGAHRWTWHVTPKDLWAGVTSVGSFGVAWRAQDGATRLRLRAAYDDAVPARVSDGRLGFDVECVLVEARRPGG